MIEPLAHSYRNAFREIGTGGIVKVNEKIHITIKLSRVTARGRFKNRGKVYVCQNKSLVKKRVCQFNYLTAINLC